MRMTNNRDTKKKTLIEAEKRKEPSSSSSAAGGLFNTGTWKDFLPLNPTFSSCGRNPFQLTTWKHLAAKCATAQC